MRRLLSCVVAIGLLASLGFSTARAVSPQEGVDTALAEMIDALAGHPDDPQLPKSALGASDEVLLATDPREIADLLQVALPFAQDRAKSPRFLFALGRAALAHGYDQRGKELLVAASERGSAAASAYLGYVAEADEDYSQAANYLRQAIDAGFNSQIARETLGLLPSGGAQTARFSLHGFNRPGLIEALYNGDVQVVESEGLMGAKYVGGIHATLWQSDILFLAEDPAILLELDPHFGLTLGLKMASSSETMEQTVELGFKSMFGPLMAMAEARNKGGGVTDELSAMMTTASKTIEPFALVELQAVQDARRLAILYNTNSEAFRKIYSGMRTFVYGVGGVQRQKARKPKIGFVNEPDLRRSVGQSRPAATLDNPISMYERLNRNSKENVPVIYRTTDGVAYICGVDPASGKFRAERIDYEYLRKDSRLARNPGPQFALGAYSHKFASAIDLVRAAASSPLRPGWGADGPLRPYVENVLKDRTFYRPDVEKACATGNPFLFCAKAESDVVHLGFSNGTIYYVYLTAIEEHLDCVDAVIAKTGCFFGATRDEHLAKIAGKDTAIGIAMRVWPDDFPTIESFLNAASTARVLPALYRHGGADHPKKPAYVAEDYADKSIARRADKSSTWPASEVTPKALYDHRNKRSRRPEPVLFRTGAQAFLYGLDPKAEKYRMEGFRPDYLKARTKVPTANSADGVAPRRRRGPSSSASSDPAAVFALEFFRHKFRSAKELAVAGEGAEMRREWDENGRVAYIDNSRFKSLIGITGISRKSGPTFFCKERFSDHVFISFLNGYGQLIKDTVFVDALQKHLNYVDATIVEEGMFFERTREEQISQILSENTGVRMVMEQWPEGFPTIESVLAAAAKAQVRPELFE